MARIFEAILTISNDEGRIYLENGTVADLDPYSLQKFLERQEHDVDFSCWCGLNQWYLQYGSLIEAASNKGEKIIAHYEKGKLEIDEENLFLDVVKRYARRLPKGRWHGSGIWDKEWEEKSEVP